MLMLRMQAEKQVRQILEVGHRGAAVIPESNQTHTVTSAELHMVRTSIVWPDAYPEVVSCHPQADQVGAPVQQSESVPVHNTRSRSGQQTHLGTTTL
jgi:hypothetical protein